MCCVIYLYKIYILHVSTLSGILSTYLSFPIHRIVFYQFHLLVGFQGTITLSLPKVFFPLSALRKCFKIFYYLFHMSIPYVINAMANDRVQYPPAHPSTVSLFVLYYVLLVWTMTIFITLFEITFKQIKFCFSLTLISLNLHFWFLYTDTSLCQRSQKQL